MRKSSRVVLASALMTILLCVAVLVADEIGDDRGKPLAGMGQISARGKVVDLQGRPQANVQVVLRVVANWLSSELATIDVKDVLAETRTDEAGRFAFANVPLDASRSQIAKRFEHGQRGADVVALADGFGLSWSSLDALAPDGESEVILRPSAAVEGTVENVDGEPLAGAGVEVIGIARLDSSEDPFLDQPENMNLIWSELRPKTVTNAEGKFRLDGLPADHRVNLWVHHADYPLGYFVAAVGEHASAEPLVHNRGNGVVEETPVYVNPVQLTLARGPRVTVHIRDARGKPLGGGRVGLLSQSRECQGRVSDDGTLHIAVASPGDYQVVYRPPEAEHGPSVSQKVTLTEAEIATPHELTITVPATREVEGRIVGEGTDRGLPGIAVIWSPEGAGDRLPASFARTTTDGEGRFRLAVLPGKGRITWQGEAEGFFVAESRTVNGVQQEKYTRSINVPASGTIEPLRIEISRGLVIQGTVVDPSGQPAPGITVAAIVDVGFGTYRKKTTSDTEGRFEFAGLNPLDPYRLFATGDGVAGVESIPPEENHPLDEQRIVKVRVALEPCVTLTGQVLFGGKPLAGVKLALKRGETIQNRIPPAGRKGPMIPAGSVSMFEVSASETDADGRYRLSGLKPGDSYQFDVKPPFPAVDPAWQHAMPWIPKLPDNAEAIVELPDMNLRRSNQSLAGVVVDPDGNPVAGATVSAMLRNGFSSLARPSLHGPAPWTETDKSGRFQLKQLPDEPLSIMSYIKKGAGPIRFPAKVNVEMNQQDIRIVLDPSLAEDE